MQENKRAKVTKTARPIYTNFIVSIDSKSLTPKAPYNPACKQPPFFLGSSPRLHLLHTPEERSGLSFIFNPLSLIFPSILIRYCINLSRPIWVFTHLNPESCLFDLYIGTNLRYLRNIYLGFVYFGDWVVLFGLKLKI